MASGSVFLHADDAREVEITLVEEGMSWLQWLSRTGGAVTVFLDGRRQLEELRDALVAALGESDGE